MSDTVGRTCCTDTEPTSARENEPGRSELSTRVGTWATFRQRMIATLPRQTVVHEDGSTSRPLGAVTTRQPDDPTLALLDAWAVACDVLAFYGERILEEGYLGTARQRESVVAIAQMLGYEPSPGVAATARLALEVKANVIDPESVTLEEGLAVMSLPPAGEVPQTFETIEAIEAREAWNSLAARTTQSWSVGAATTEIWLDGVATRLQRGDVVVVTDAGVTDWVHVRVFEVEVDTTSSRTRVTLAKPLGIELAAAPVIHAFRSKSGIFGCNAPDFRSLNSELKASYDMGDFETTFSLAGRAMTVDVGGTPVPIAHAVPLISRTTWPAFDLEDDTDGLDLERETDRAPEGSFVLAVSGSNAHFSQITAHEVASRTDFTLVGKVSRLTLESSGDLFTAAFGRRSTVVHYGSEELPPAEAPWTDPVSGDRLDLALAITEMEAGRVVLVTGTVAEADTDGTYTVGEPVSLEMVLSECLQSTDMAGEPYTTLVFDAVLPVRLDRSTVVVYGNTALATHGQSVSDEVLGSGDATVAHARYTLRQAPLTWVPAATASGGESSLELRVGGVLWERVDSFYTAGPSDRVYTLRTGDDGKTTVQFGDGVRGSRVPTGANNIVVSYRKGIGLEGEVGANQLTLLQTRPMGLVGVRCPGPASGAADPEDIEDARINAPLKVLTLDRLVSLSDYEDFARAFAGIGKASARELWTGRKSIVHLTVASASGEELDPLAEGGTIDTLKGAIATYGDPTHVVYVDSHVEAMFTAEIRVAVDAAYERGAVVEAIRAALAEAFSFAARSFGQPVAASELAAIAHGVDGVVGIDVDRLYRSGDPAAYNAVLRAKVATWSASGSPGQAELLLVDANTLVFTELTA